MRRLREIRKNHKAWVQVTRQASIDICLAILMIAVKTGTCQNRSDAVSDALFIAAGYSNLEAPVPIQHPVIAQQFSRMLRAGFSAPHVPFRAVVAASPAIAFWMVRVKLECRGHGLYPLTRSGGHTRVW
jgi:hypothetical protein